MTNGFFVALFERCAPLPDGLRLTNPAKGLAIPPTYSTNPQQQQQQQQQQANSFFI